MTDIQTNILFLKKVEISIILYQKCYMHGKITGNVLTRWTGAKVAMATSSSHLLKRSGKTSLKYCSSRKEICRSAQFLAVSWAIPPPFNVGHQPLFISVHILRPYILLLHRGVALGQPLSPSLVNLRSFSRHCLVVTTSGKFISPSL